MTKTATIAANTFTEVIRQPIYLIVIGCGSAMILLSPYFTMFTLLENNKMVKDMGLSTILLCGLLLAAFSASNVIYQEVENKTLLVVICKPVSRASFIIGKYLGVLLGLLAAQYLLMLVLGQTVRTEITEAMYSKSDHPVWVGYLIATLFSLSMAAFANFFYEKPFTSAAITFALPAFTLIFLVLCLVDSNWHLQPFAKPLEAQIFIASFVIFLATAVLCAVATTASTRLGPIPTMGLCSAVFLLGLFSDYLFGRNVNSSWLAQLCYNVIPNLQIYWLADAVVVERQIPFNYLHQVLLYTLLFVAAMLSFAIVLFQEREA
jgi:ABC-type transport system involved in multi-copper enzyme maturation permease subunit